MTPDGATVDDHAKSAARQFEALGIKGAAAVADPESPPFPEPLEYLWTMFMQHAAGLVPVSEGYSRVTWESLRAWRVELLSWEADVLISLGNIRANVGAEWRAKQMKT